VLERVRDTGLLPAGSRTVVLLSGGRDSVCLLGMAVELCGRVQAVHVNYGLRGAAADADEQLCAQLCERLGVVLRVERVSRPPDASGNLQAWARDVRYAAGARLAGVEDALLATGHTSTDQAETVLYRLAASPGRRALLGMPARSGRLVRPLLVLTREETAAWCTAQGLPWREDASNDSGAYARNRVRAGLVPALRAVDPRAEANVVRTAELLRDEAEVLDVVVDTALAGRLSIPTAHLAVLPRALARLVVRRLAEEATGGLCPRAAGRLDDILALGGRGPEGGPGALDLGDGARAEVREGVLRMVRTPVLDHTRRADSEPVASARMRDKAIGDILVQPDALRRRVEELGAQITADYAGKDLLLVGVLKGAIFFLADVMRHIGVPCDLDFMAVSSYGSATDSSGVVRILKDLDAPLEGRDVLIVEDIVDSGLTLQYLLRNLGARDPASLEVCALLTKPTRRKVELDARYVGFEIPDRFVIGYGLDFDEKYRNLPYVAAVTDEAVAAAQAAT